MNLASRVIHAVSLISGYAEGAIKPEDSMESKLGMDSLDKIEVVMYLEEEFEVTIEDSETDECKTVADVIALVERKVGVAA